MKPKMFLMIDKTISIEDLVDNYPKSIDFLSRHKIRCIRCGEPIWGTLEEAAGEKDYSDSEIEQLVKKLNDFLVEIEKPQD